MLRQSFILLLLFFLIAAFSFETSSNVSTSQEVKNFFLEEAEKFKLQTDTLNKAIKKGDEKQIQEQFFKTRYAYKQIEIFAEYFYAFYAVKLNGPAIPFFEEADPDVPVQQPTGMQLIETDIFPHFNKKKKNELQDAAAELVRYAAEMPTINEDFDFDDNNIFDAVMEELFRITALGITGFDSQVAFNSLQECKSSLNGLQYVLHFYQEGFEKKLPGKFAELDLKLTESQKYLDEHNNFNSFSRMEFIQQYLNPITSIVGAYKTANNYKDNPASLYYSAIKKNNTLFAPSAFNPYRFLDDYTTSPSKIELGRKLFFEKKLSSNNERSCASCHQPEKAFTDGLKTSMALDGHSALLRNAPTIWNAALQRNLFTDSRGRTLEDQVMQVLNNAKEMHGSAKETAEKIIQQPEYKMLYEKAYSNAKPEKTAQNICNAIASYERTLIALNSRFDQYMNGKAVLNNDELKGFNLFMGKARCGSCHFMPLFSGAKPPRYYYIESEVLGVPVNTNKKHAKLDNDSGRYLITGSPVHIFSFKTPSLRNAAVTAPYMHNGVFNTLEEVVDFYNNGGGKGLHIAPPNQSLAFDKLNLSKEEKKDIVLFIKTLTDTSGIY
jgi:cytochrome c peroxidase